MQKRTPLGLAEVLLKEGKHLTFFVGQVIEHDRRQALNGLRQLAATAQRGVYARQRRGICRCSSTMASTEASSPGLDSSGRSTGHRSRSFGFDQVGVHDAEAEARRPARTGPDGSLIPLGEQDRSRWDAAAITEGTALVCRALSQSPPGPYQIQAAIAAVHAEAARAADTDWRQVLALYGVLERLTPTPVVRLNRAVATALVHGPQAGLGMLEPLDRDPRTAGYHRLAAVRAHLLEIAGRYDAARASYLLAARQTTSLPERRYLESRAAAMSRYAST